MRLAALLLLLIPWNVEAAEMWPVQGDISAFWQVDAKTGAHEGRGGAAWLGYAFWLDRAPDSAFFSSGVEVTLSDASTGAPHAWTAGGGTRMGWGTRSSKKHPYGNPDFYAYGRVTPFVAFEDERFAGGARFGIGFTAPGWTRLLASGLTATGSDCDSTGTVCDALAVAYLAAMLTNHFEAFVEVSGYDRDHLSTRFGLRVGAGF